MGTPQACKPVTVPFQPWIPLHARIEEMVSLTPWEAPPNSGALQPKVITSTDGEAVLTEGLFPHRILRQLVWVKDDGSPTKYGQRPLSWEELAMLYIQLKFLKVD